MQDPVVSAASPDLGDDDKLTRPGYTRLLGQTQEELLALESVPAVPGVE